MPSWLILTHQLPSHPSNARVKVWRKLQTLGAVPIKNSIYALPNHGSMREDFEWLRKEILQMKGEASIFVADSINQVEDKEIVQAFQTARAKDFDRVIEEAGRLAGRIRSLLEGGHMKPETIARLDKDWKLLRMDWDRLQKIDFFRAPNRLKATSSIQSAQKLFEQARTLSVKGVPKAPPPADLKALQVRVWVTRKFPHIDRLASAWLICRYIDPKARFKFVNEPYTVKVRREVRFDMVEAEFTHYGDWCTFETFLYRLGLKNPALAELAQIVHDIDLKDNKFGRSEAAGIASLISGLCRLRKGNDFELLEAGIGIFDALYEELKQK